MGADFLLVWTEWPWRDGAPVPDEEARDEYHARIAGLSDSQLERIREGMFDDDDLEPHEMQMLLRNDADEMFVTERRDTFLGHVGDQWLLFTGGVTFGDPPTDAFVPIGRLAEMNYVIEHGAT